MCVSPGCRWCAPKKGSAGQSAASPSLSPGRHPELRAPHRPATRPIPPNLTELSLLGSTEVTRSKPLYTSGPHVASGGRGRNSTMVFKNFHDNRPVRFPHSGLTVTSEETPHVGGRCHRLLWSGTRGPAPPRGCAAPQGGGGRSTDSPISGLGLRDPVPTRGSAPNLSLWVPTSSLPPRPPPPQTEPQSGRGRGRRPT